MALWAGMEPWRGGAAGVALLLCGLALAAGGAATLGRSEAVSRVAEGADDAPEQDQDPQRPHHRPEVGLQP
jgi:hypothetical protein